MEDISLALAIVALRKANEALNITHHKKVDQLPAIGEEHVLYFVPRPDLLSHDNCDEYVWDGTKYEKVGSTEVDITGKADKVDTAGINNVAAFDDKGNLKDSGVPSADILLKPTSYTGGNIPELNANGGIFDSGVKAENISKLVPLIDLLTNNGKTLTSSDNMNSLKEGFYRQSGTVLPQNAPNGANNAYILVLCRKGDARYTYDIYYQFWLSLNANNIYFRTIVPQGSIFNGWRAL